MVKRFRREEIHTKGDDSMPSLVRSYGKYKIWTTTMNDFVVKDENNKVVFTTKGEDAAIEWCKRH